MDKAGRRPRWTIFVPLHIGGCDVSDRCDSATVPPVEDTSGVRKFTPISRRLGNEQRREFPWSFRGHAGPTMESTSDKPRTHNLAQGMTQLERAQLGLV